MMDSVCMDTSEIGNERKSSSLPAWRMPISTSFSTSLRKNSGGKNSDEICPVDLLLASHPQSTSSSSSDETENMRENDENSKNNNSPDSRPAVPSRNQSVEKEEESQVIQILLPCIICNRTFSPEALERHAKVCTKVNIKSPYKPERGKFDITEKRKKDTLLEHFIPPPTFDALTDNRFGMTRGSRNRCSLRGTSCTTRSTLNSPGVGGGGLSVPTTAQRSRERSVSQTRESRASSTTRSSQPPPAHHSHPQNGNEYPYDDASEFGSNNSEENNAPENLLLPRYAKPIAPTDVCPYCNRTFGIKSYDRHVEFCKEIYERKRYEIQPVPKEKEEALERQEIRTKYRPMKSSSSCSSLRSMSPGKDFANMAMKLFGGLRRTEGSANLYFNQIKNNLKKSNESIANSCYGDYTRGTRRTSPSPARTSAQTAANKLNNLLTKSYLQQQHQHQQQQFHHQYGGHHPQSPGSLLPMRINTSSNIPKLTKSTDSLSYAGNTYSHVSSSGYGQPPAILMMNSNHNSNNAFSRNSRSRSSLHKNFFRTKRVEPEGTENTSTLSQSPTATSPLIITPVNFFSKGNKLEGSLTMSADNNKNKGMMMMEETSRPTGGASLLSPDPDYDPYEKAAKQLEELLKTTPINKSKRTSRRTGLEKAFESVGVPSDMPSGGKSRLGRAISLDYNSDPFGIGVGGGGGRATRVGVGVGSSSRRQLDPYGLGGMSMTPNIDDSYWDQILRKGDNTQQITNNNSNNQSHPETASSSHEESDTSGASDTAKSRAMSNTSSADSAFSRSEGNDPEFEALESIVSLASITNNSSNRYKPSSRHEDRRNTSAELFSTKGVGSLEPTRSVPRSASLDHGRVPMDTSPVPDSNSVSINKQKNNDQLGGGGGAWAKFCHECGTPYPTSLAKFCPECGEKRVYKT